MSGKTKKMVFIALSTALICVLSPFTVMLPFSPVPVSLTIFAIFTAVYATGMKSALASTALYILIGLVGVPVFSGFTGGAGKLLGPTGGYIIGYMFVALLSGLFIDRYEGKVLMHVIGMVAGTAVCYLIGTVWLAKVAGMDFMAALSAGVLPFIPADAVKIFAAVLAGPRLRRAVRSL